MVHRADEQLPLQWAMGLCAITFSRQSTDSVVVIGPRVPRPARPDERRGLSPLFWTNINPYGTFRLDMDHRIDITPTSVESIL